MNKHAAGGLSQISAGLSLPVIVAPMFLVSGPRLVVATCRNGMIGSFPVAYARNGADLRRWFQDIEDGLADDPAMRARYAANLIVHPTNRRLEQDLDLICEFRVPIVIASVGNAAPIVERVHTYGGIVLTDVARISHARKAIDSGVDGLILLCAGAGGHTGWLSPFAFVPEVRQFYDGPVILAGAISDGAGLHAAQALGADLAYVGTRFIAALESDAKPEYRDMVVESGADDIALTAAVSGLPANWLKASLKSAGYTDLDTVPSGPFDFDEKLKAWRDVWGAGHGVGATRSIAGVQEIAAELAAEYGKVREARLQ